MDAVNPDYLVVKVLNRLDFLYGWTLPGTMIFGIFPTIIQIYHGALPFYVGLPFYLIFGTDLIGIRIVNAIFALLVLCSTFAALKALRVRSLVIVFVLTALALDPGFIFSFRTQFYITLLPISLVMLAIVINQKDKTNDRLRWNFCSGLLTGLAVYGYFIYLFFAPILFFHAIASSRLKTRSSLIWLLGLSVGCSPYAVGYGLMAYSLGGVTQFRDFIALNLSSLGVAPSSMGLLASLSFIRETLVGSILDFGPSSIMLHQIVGSSFPHIKVVLLAIVPIAYAGVALISPKRHTPIYVIVGLLAGLSLLFLVLGRRLGLHHAIPSLPIMYVGLALSAEAACLTWAGRRLLRLSGTLAIFGMLGFVIFMNALDRHAVFVELERTGGVGLSSDAIIRFAEDNSVQAVPTRAFFPDWGVFMSFEMITSGSPSVITDFSPEVAVKTLCSGQDVLLGTIEGRSSDRIQDWSASIGWGEPAIQVFSQRNGTPVLTAARWSASALPHAPCP